MSKPGDTLVLILLVGVIFYFLLRKWLPVRFSQSLLQEPPQDEEDQIQGEVPRFLSNYGYEVVRRKEKVPISIQVDEQVYESRLFVDYIAKLGDEWYLVILAKERKPLRISGPALRDFFLSYFLLYQPKGILYVDLEKEKFKVIRIDVPDLTFQEKKGFNWLYLITFVLGFGLALFIFL
ncbi:hypothetical protein [Hazenella coriacea]|uniref:Uncharacterized protein n=1 Tax=Hazenella coriacea TaxID=1179467 RepID=A0A4R3LB27_9BACL|nr:hypothetical protein [Hazenella coriacea]TCS96375.1 hypothetical protein EDD58_1016 [Hazenella coriacea]